jgi:Ca2+-dependent lipid-binding protein
MKYFNEFLFLFTIVIFPVIIYYIMMYYINNIEGFTPSIRELYRPIIRQTTSLKEKLVDKNLKKIHTSLRKNGIM